MIEKKRKILFQETESSPSFLCFQKQKWFDAIVFLDEEMGFNCLEIFLFLRSEQVMLIALEYAIKKGVLPRESEENFGDLINCLFPSKKTFLESFKKDFNTISFEKEMKEFEEKVLPRFEELEVFEKIKDKKIIDKEKPIRF